MTTVVRAQPLLDSPADLDLMVNELRVVRMRIMQLQERAADLQENVLSAMTKGGFREFTSSTGATARVRTDGLESLLEME